MGKLFFAHAAAVIRDLHGQPVSLCICIYADRDKRSTCTGGIFRYIQYV